VSGTKLFVVLVASVWLSQSSPQPPAQATPVARPVETVSVALKAGSREHAREKLAVRAAQALTISLEGTGRALSYDVKGPDGKSLLPAQRPREWLGESTWIERFWMRGWAGGDLSVELEAEVFSSAGLTVTVHYDEGFQIHPMVVPTVWTVGEPFNLSACLTRTGEVVVAESAELAATVVTPDGERREVQLVDDGEHGEGQAGDGIFGRVARTMDAGRHEVSFRARYRVDGNVVERERRAVYYAIGKDKAARFSGEPIFRGLDGDDDGLFNSLSIRFPVHYPKGAKIAIHAILEDAKGNVVHPDVTVMAKNMVAKEDHVIAIGVESERIVRRATDGPFVLRHIRMWDKRADRLLDVLSDVTSEPFRVDTFDPPKPKEPAKPATPPVPHPSP
jgi:hypothetical protein